MELMINVEPEVKAYVNDINPSGKKVIVFLHGWPADYRLFEYQYNVLPHMGYRCVGIDIRGFGKSDKPWSSYSYDRLADDLFIIIKKLNLHNAALLGHSTAGAVAVRYMARHKGFGVSKLVLCAAAAPILLKTPDFPEGLDADAINKIIEGAYTDRPSMLNDFGSIFFHQKVSQYILDWLFQMGLQAASWSTIAVAEDWLVENVFNDFSKIHVPTLIMHGVHDKVCPYSLASVQNENIMTSTLVTFKNSGHGLFYDEMDKFNLELVQFTG